MIGKRSIRSLAQLLELQNGDTLRFLLEKHGLISRELLDAVEYRSGVLPALVTCLESGGESEIVNLLSEVARTQWDLRFRVSPKYRYDERFADLQACLQLDGYVLGNGKFTSIDPSVIGSPPLEDDLTREITDSGLPNANDVIYKLADSVEAFRASSPNYNASLNDARVALETLAADIAHARISVHPGTFDSTKWGSVIAYLRSSGFITIEQEKGLAGVFGFVTPGSHRPLGFSEMEFARLGRSWLRACAGS
jgi:hypothetical protein